jgi:competence protein ComGD
MKQGFTLIEIFTIIGIVVVFSFVIAPVFRSYGPSLGLSGAVRELVTDCRYAQQMAITEQKEYCLKFFPTEKKYQILKCGAQTVIKEKTFSSQIQSLDLDGLVSDEVRYNPYGAVSQSGNIILENVKNETKTISIKPSGFVEIID